MYLDVQSICYNVGLRSIAKLALNSFYGKFVQKTNMKRTCYVTEYEKLYNLLTDRTKMIKVFHILDEGMVAIEYVKSKGFLEINTNTNVIIASFCTTYARLKLWNVMLKLGDCVTYHDTDSVIYSYYPGQWRPPTGCYLDLTDELTCKAIGCSDEA